MSPLVRYTVAVLLTLLCWRQTLIDGLAGRVELATAATRFLVIFLVARTAMRMIGNLVDRYQANVEQSGTASMSPNLTHSAHIRAGATDRSSGTRRTDEPPDEQTGDEP